MPQWRIIAGGTKCIPKSELPLDDVDPQAQPAAPPSACLWLHPSDLSIALSASTPLYPPGRIIHVVHNHPPETWWENRLIGRTGFRLQKFRKIVFTVQQKDFFYLTVRLMRGHGYLIGKLYISFTPEILKKADSIAWTGIQYIAWRAWVYNASQRFFLLVWAHSCCR